MRNDEQRRPGRGVIGSWARGLLALCFLAGCASDRASQADQDPAREAVAHAPIFVLLHGWASDSTVWSTLAPRLPGLAVSVDAPGHGRAPIPAAGFSFSGYAEAARAAAGRLSGGPVVLVAHSNGSYAAREYYRAHPDEVCAIVLLDGTWRRQFEDPEAFRGRVTSMTEDGWRRLVTAMSAPAGASQETLQRLPNMLAGVPLSSVVESSLALLTPELYREDQVLAPVLLIFASPEVWTQEHLDYMATIAPRLRTAQIPSVSHWLPWDAPDQVEALVEEFVPRACGT